jgi:hypothetical protein
MNHLELAESIRAASASILELHAEKIHRLKEDGEIPQTLVQTLEAEITQRQSALRALSQIAQHIQSGTEVRTNFELAANLEKKGIINGYDFAAIEKLYHLHRA